MKALVVLGTRPEGIKLAPVIHELRRRQGIHCAVCVTAQHREMLDQVLRIFCIRPDYDLGVMTENQTPAQVAAAVLRGLEPVLEAERPDWVLVQGDTTTVAVAALAAFYQRARVGHVEAGLRTGDKWRPFPEEIHRRVVGVIADLHFAPTASARANLLREGVDPRAVVVTGNPVIDALHWVAAQPLSSAAQTLLEQTGALDGRRLILVTAHRRESFGPGLVAICQALQEIVAAFPEVTILYPVHQNPNVWEPVHRMLGKIPRILLTPPLDYLTFVHIMRHAFLVLTDSGGIQEEAPGLGKPVLVLREVTERPEAVTAGVARLVGTDPQRIIEAVSELLTDPLAYAQMARAVNPFGDGRAAVRIVSALLGEPVEPFALGAEG
jgi:UDP-N-acetylglucosamine 2-epimerase (non-hydrolysing)